MQTSMATQLDVTREKFNSQDLKSKITTVNEYVFFYLLLLQVAFELNIISNLQQNKIVDNLTQAINTASKANLNTVSNYMYVISLYLQEKSNWEAWKELEMLIDNKNTNAFLARVTLWFTKKLHLLKNELAAASKDIQSMENEAYNSDLQCLFLEIKKLEKALSANTQVSLKREHNSQIAISYFFIRPIVSSNYLFTLQLTIRNFIKEISILKKLDAKSIFSKQKGEIQEASKAIKERQKKLMDSLSKELDCLKAEYEKKKQAALDDQNDFDKKLQELENEFRKNNPELSESEFEEAFDTYFDDLPDTFWEDEDDPFWEDEKVEEVEEIDRWYKKEKEKIIHRFNKMDAILEEDAFNDQMDNEPLYPNSLTNVILEFELFALANNSKIMYPTSLAEKNKKISGLSVKEAIPEFISAFGSKLSDSDIAYLKSE